MTKLSRRGAFGAALAAAALPAVTLAASAEASPDAELIRICAEHPAKLAALHAAPDSEPDDGPTWQAYERSCEAINAAVPQTLAGMIAKAQAAKVEQLGIGYTTNPEGTLAAPWSWDLLHDLLRLAGAVAFPPAAVAALAPDARLIADCSRYAELEAESCRLLNTAGKMRDRDPRCVALRKQANLLDDEIAELHERITYTRARTPAGLRAKARAVSLDMGDNGAASAGPMNSDDHMAWSLLQDVLRGGVA
ncbi:hypothetical protein [Roseomonas sp. BN140053]|uniref:hypothetical protein n=1 Tax=Roseomonas sp. BN140053 TaxID=3391898 RepID=UPI0039E8B1E8